MCLGKADLPFFGQPSVECSPAARPLLISFYAITAGFTYWHIVSHTDDRCQQVFGLALM